MALGSSVGTNLMAAWTHGSYSAMKCLYDQQVSRLLAGKLVSG